ncbi:MAG: hypothetical protein IID17_12190 [Nitrospinae bacterium]|nr:hypothetical protein [Nitrospinota bacterium]
MAKLIDFTGGQKQQPLGGDLIRNIQLKQLLERSRKRPPILSKAQGFAQLGGDAIDVFTLMRLRAQLEAKDNERTDAVKDFGASIFGKGGRSQIDPGFQALVDRSDIERGPQAFGPLPARLALGNGNVSPNFPKNQQNTNQALSLGPNRLSPPANLAQSARPNFITNIPPEPIRPPGPLSQRLQQFNALVKINPNAALNFAIQHDPSRRQQESIFAKPAIRDFTPDSVRAFQQSRNAGDLRRNPNAPSSQVISALIPTILGGLDFNNPQELIKGLQTIQAASSALSNPDQAQLSKVLEIIEQNQRAAPPVKPGEPGFLSQGLNFAKEKGIQLKNFLIERFKNGIPDPQEIQDFFNNEVAPKATSLSDRLFDGFQNFQPGPLSIGPGNVNRSAGRNQGNVSVEDREVFEFEPNAVIDENGFFYKPNATTPGGKQFIRDRATGRKLRSSNFK